jgi:precorrin-2/cobalt-factor-2 C20-methyltransferase
VLMKVGNRLRGLLDALEARGLLDYTVFVAHAGMPNQCVETDVRQLRGRPEDTGYLSLLIVQADRPSPATENHA